MLSQHKYSFCQLLAFRLIWSSTVAALFTTLRYITRLMHLNWYSQRYLSIFLYLIFYFEAFTRLLIFKDFKTFMSPINYQIVLLKKSPNYIINKVFIKYNLLAFCVSYEWRVLLSISKNNYICIIWKIQIVQ